MNEQRPIQKSIEGLGEDKVIKAIGAAQDNILKLHARNPGLVEHEQHDELLFNYWLAFEGLETILGDSYSKFLYWWKHTATKPSTITRAMRALTGGNNPKIKLSEERERQRRGAERKYRDAFGGGR